MSEPPILPPNPPPGGPLLSAPSPVLLGSSAVTKGRGQPPTARVLALTVLEAHRAGARGFIEDVLESALDGQGHLAGRERGLLRELVLGVVRHRATLDCVIAAFSHRAIHQLDGGVREALRLGVYQLVYLDRMAAFAAVDQTVESLRACRLAHAAGFVNAVLRAVLRGIVWRGEGPAGYYTGQPVEVGQTTDAETPRLVANTTTDQATPNEGPTRDGNAPSPGVDAQALPLGGRRWVRFTRAVLPSRGGKQPPAVQGEADVLGAAYSYPGELAHRWVARWGTAQAERLLAAGNQAPPVVLRVNVRRLDRDGLVARLISDGVAAQAGWHPLSVVLDRPGCRLPEIAAFAEGLATAQDSTASEVGLAVAPQRGQRILDLCAAPGGKTTHLAELLDDDGQVVAVDVSPAKLAAITANAQRLGLRCITTCVVDEMAGWPDHQQRFDAVLVDAPCSNSGVLARRVEARWRLSSRELLRLSTQQLALLRQGADHVAPGGRLVYSTCSIEPEENEGVVGAFAITNPEFALIEQVLTLPEDGDPGTPARAAQWRDGGYRAVWQRRAEP